MWQAYQELSAEGRLPIRVYVMLDVADPKYPEMLKKGIIRSYDDKLFVRSVKISSDGALGSQGAALHEQYSDKPGHFGLLLHEIPTNSLTLQAMKAGFQVNTLPSVIKPIRYHWMLLPRRLRLQNPTPLDIGLNMLRWCTPTTLSFSN